MKTRHNKIAIKLGLVSLVVAMLALVPGNSKLLFGYGESGADTSGQFHQDVCENTAPLQVVLYQPNHPALPKSTVSGEVILNWLKLAQNADRYTIAYGVQPGNYIYGLPNVGNVNSFTVQFLNPGQTYYFAVRGVNGCMPGPWSQEWAARAPGGSGGEGIIPSSFVLTPGTRGTQPTNLTSPQQRRSPSPAVSPRASGTPQGSPSTRPQSGGSFLNRLINWFTGLFR